MKCGIYSFFCCFSGCLDCGPEDDMEDDMAVEGGGREGGSSRCQARGRCSPVTRFVLLT